MEYIVIRHKRRKKLMLIVKVTGEVEVRAGYFTGDKTIQDFVSRNEQWIKTQQAKFSQKYHHIITVKKEDVPQLRKQLLLQMTQLVNCYSAVMGLAPAGIKITSAQKRWGSCNSSKSICFSYRLALVSDRCRQYVAIHELAHLKELNHSKNFYDIVKKYMPDYKEAEKELAGYYIREE